MATWPTMACACCAHLQLQQCQRQHYYQNCRCPRCCRTTSAVCCGTVQSLLEQRNSCGLLLLKSVCSRWYTGGMGGIGKSVCYKVYQQHYTLLLIHTLTDYFSMCASTKNRITDNVCVKNIVVYCICAAIYY